MTTIVYRDGVMAGDGRETMQNDEDSSWFKLRDDCVKVFKLKSGHLFGAAHGSEDIDRLHAALVKNLPPPKLEDVAGLMVDKQRKILLYEGNIWQHIKMPYYAVGSGSIIAFAAMDMGATAIEAVKVAIKRDIWSGGKITSVRMTERGHK